MSSTPKIRYVIMRDCVGFEGEFEFMEHNQQCWTPSLKKARMELRELKEDTYPEDDPEELKLYKVIVTEVK